MSNLMSNSPVKRTDHSQLSTMVAGPQQFPTINTVLAHPNDILSHYPVLQTLFGLYSVTAQVILTLVLELGFIDYG